MEFSEQQVTHRGTNASGGLRVLPGDEASVHNHLGRPLRRRMVLCAPLRQRTGEQEWHHMVELYRALFIVGEGTDVLAGNEIGTIGERDVDQCGRAVAHRADQATSLVDATCHTQYVGTVGKVPHRTVAAGEKDRRILRGIGIPQTLRMTHGLAEPWIVPVAGIDRVIEFQSVHWRLAALDRRELNRDACFLQLGQRVRDFPQVIAGRLAGVALGAMAGQDEQHRFDIGTGSRGFHGLGTYLDMGIRGFRMDECGDGKQQQGWQYMRGFHGSLLTSDRVPHCIGHIKRDKLAKKTFIYSQGDKMSRRFDYLGDVEAFLAVAEHGSFTAGAVVLSTTPSVLSRAVIRLEARLGNQLLRRTTRRVSLTEAGRLYLEQARVAFTLLDDAEREIQGQEGELIGRVRLSVPTTYGHYRLPPLLARFARQYPGVQVELSITNRNVDLVAEGFDLAIRLGHFSDSGLVARKLEDATLCLVASPDYLERAGTPQTLEDLREHACLPFVMPSTGRIAPWVFKDGQNDIDWLPTSTIEISDDVLGVVSLADQGMGICQSYDFIVHDPIERGRLVELLPQLRGRTRPFSVIYVPHRRQSAATRALIDLLTAQPCPALPD